MERVEINRVERRGRACAAGEVEEGWRERERELTESDRVSVRCVFEALTHLLAHRALTHLNLLPRAFGGAVEMNQGTTGAEPKIGEPPLLSTRLHSALRCCHLIQAHQSFHCGNRLFRSAPR